MRLKQNVLDISDKMKELLETSMKSMENHRISPEQIYKNLKQLDADLERLTALVKREPEEK